MKTSETKQIKNEFILTDEEKEVVTNLRKVKLKSEVSKIFQRHLTEVFYKYVVWMREEGGLPTYSTLVNDFLYHEKDWNLPDDITFSSDTVSKNLGILISTLTECSESQDFSNNIDALYEKEYNS